VSKLDTSQGADGKEYPRKVRPVAIIYAATEKAERQIRQDVEMVGAEVLAEKLSSGVAKSLLDAKRQAVREQVKEAPTLEGEPEEVQCLIMNNTRRRQLSRDEVDAIIGYWLKHFPRRSNNWIAEDIGVSDMTVEAKRQEMESASQIRKVDSVEGKDGKTYPRTKRRRSQPKTEPDDEATLPKAELFGIPVWFDRVR